MFETIRPGDVVTILAFDEVPAVALKEVLQPKPHS